MIKKIISATILIAFVAVGVSAQTKPSPSPSPVTPPVVAPTPVNLETILDEADKQTIFYRQVFRDLLATETKTFEEFDKNGELDRETVIESNFLVYQSAKDDKTSSELRNVLKVNGSLVPDSQARADRFLAELEKTKTLESELEKIQNEGLRYDKAVSIINFTLFQAITLDKVLRSSINFSLVGTENYQGSEVFVVGYEQTKKSPLIIIDEKESKNPEVRAYFDINLPGSLKKNDKFLRGKLWIDAKTYQIWREERQVIVQTNAAPLVVQEAAFEYNPSEFGILVPKKITFLDNNLKKISKDNNFSAVKDTKITFDYSKFKKTNVEVQIGDDEN